MEKRASNIVLESVNKHEVRLWLSNTFAKHEAITSFQLYIEVTAEIPVDKEQVPHHACVQPSPTWRLALHFPGIPRNFSGLNNSLPWNSNILFVSCLLHGLTYAVQMLAQNHKWWYPALASNLIFKKCETSSYSLSLLLNSPTYVDSLDHQEVSGGKREESYCRVSTTCFFLTLKFWVVGYQEDPSNFTDQT